MDIPHIEHSITDFIRRTLGAYDAVVGLSGGVDSSVVATLAARALGPSRVMGLIMPSASNTPDDEQLAMLLAQQLGIRTTTISIDPLVSAFTASTPFFTGQKNLGNLKARIRMCLLYGAAHEHHAYVLGTGNKTEIMVGYATKYGDAGCDLLPIGELYKTEVWQLARHLSVPAEIIERPPTAGLWEGQTDEGELGITYERIDALLQAIENNNDLSGFLLDDVTRVQQYISQSAHKRALPPICPR